MTANEPVLSARALNRAALARQSLLDRADAPIPTMVERMGGIQAQYAPAMYVALWSRLRGFGRDALTRALEDRSVVQGTLLRATIHLVSARDYWPLATAVRAERRLWWTRVAQRRASAADYAAGADVLRERLASGPLQRRAVEELLGKDVADGVGFWVDLVRVPPSGTWERRRADLYATAADWLGGEPDIDPDEAAAHVVRRYLGAFGPATRANVASWAGVRVGALAAGFARVETRTFRDSRGRALIDLPDAPLPDPDTPAPPRFLPVWDATLLVHARHTGILPEQYRARVFTTKNPHSVDTFLVDGAVAGAWRYADGRVELEPYHWLDHATLRALRDEADRLAEFMR
jgi:hypothetical protein